MDANPTIFTPLVSATLQVASQETPLSPTDQRVHQVADRALTTPSQEPPIASSSLADHTLALNPESLKRSSSKIELVLTKQMTFVTRYAGALQAGASTLDRLGKASAALSQSSMGASDASGVLSAIGLVASLALAIKTFVKDVRPARLEVQALKEAIALLKKMKQDPDSVDRAQLQARLPSDVALPTQESIDQAIGTIEGKLEQAKSKLQAAAMRSSVHLAAGVIAGINLLSKILQVAGQALKFIGTVSGVLIVIVALINLVNTARALHSTRRQLDQLKNELAGSHDPLKQEKLKGEIAKLVAMRRAQIFALVMSVVELALGIAFIAANLGSAGAAIPAVIGLLAASTVISTLGNAFFAAQVVKAQTKASEPTVAPELENHSTGNLPTSLSASMASFLQEKKQALS